MLPGASGLRWMPRKMAGIALMTIEPSIVAIIMVSVVFDSAIHLYSSDTWAEWLAPRAMTGGPDGRGCRLDITPTGSEFTFRRLLASNHLPARAGVAAAGRRSHQH